MESAGSGLLAGITLAARLRGLTPPRFSGRTALGAMARYVRAQNRHFQPMNCAFGLIDALEAGPGQRKIRDKQKRYEAISQRALAEIDEILHAEVLGPTSFSGKNMVY